MKNYLDLEYIEDIVCNEFELWVDKKTGQQYEVPVEHIRNFKEAKEIKPFENPLLINKDAIDALSDKDLKKVSDILDKINY